MKRLKICMTFFLPVFCCFSLPKGGKTTFGQCGMKWKEKVLEIEQKTSKSVIDWEDFSIDLQERVRCKLPDKTCSILHKVVGKKISKIDGKLISNAKVYLINENGIFIQENGVIRAQDFIASTHLFSNKEFIEDNMDVFLPKKGEVINRGLIIAKKGKVKLLGKNIHNSGNIECAEAYLYSLEGCMNLEGVIEAKSAKNVGGEIFLSAEKGTMNIEGDCIAKNPKKGGKISIQGERINIFEKSHIQTSSQENGGNICIGKIKKESEENSTAAQGVWIAQGATILADALTSGKGGDVLVWSDKQTLFGAHVSAKGGKNFGDGGLVEISGKQQLVYEGDVDTTAVKGATGTLVFDPSDIVIDLFGGVSVPPFPTTPPGTYDPIGGLGQLAVANILTALLANNVLIQTTAGAGGLGTVTFNQGLTWATNNTFTVIADRNIVVNSGLTISNTNNLSANFNAIDFQANIGGTTNGNFSGIFLDRCTISSARGNITMQAVGGNTANDHGIQGFNASISSTGIGTESAQITLNGTARAEGGGLSMDGVTISSIDGNISCTGVGNGSANFMFGAHFMNSSQVISTGTGPNAATILLDGTGGSGVNDDYGVFLDVDTLVSSVDGNIDITAISQGTGDFNPGVVMQNDCLVSSTGTGVSAALVDFNSTSGTGDTENHGILMLSSIITSIDGNIGITAVSQGTGDINHGVLLQDISEISSTGAGGSAADITIMATPGGGSFETIGVRGELGSSVSSLAGTVTITGGLLIDVD